MNLIELCDIDKRRIFVHKDIPIGDGAIVYWMSRDIRANDNWALIAAYNVASKLKRKLKVVFCLSNSYPSGNTRNYSFLLDSLREVSENLGSLNIPLILLRGNPPDILSEYCSTNSIGAVICDFDPLKHKKQWIQSLVSKTNIPLPEVDAHNIVPCRFCSPKEEFAAYTIRPKIKRLLGEFLSEYPQLEPFPWNDTEEVDNDFSLPMDLPIISSSKFIPGEAEAHSILSIFLNNKIDNYANGRNIPGEDHCSNLSPYLHFGNISAQRVALEALKLQEVNGESRDAFLEELIVRRELADNYCFYNENYDNFSGFQTWARTTLNEHRADHREYCYSLDTLENATTHDEYWNAAQNEMASTGKMHGYMRMYWAKKILEWSESPEQAQEFAIYLNDKYSIDGRDANGYVGIAWAIGGVHDRAWSNREVFGKIRYMNAAGLKRKFDMKKYLADFS